MADLLTRLAERALGVAAVVQPVISSAFVPGLPFENVGASEGGERQMEDGSSAISTPPPRLAGITEQEQEHEQEHEPSSVPRATHAALFEPQRGERAPVADTVAAIAAAVVAKGTASTLQPEEVSRAKSPRPPEPQASFASPRASPTISPPPPAAISVETRPLIEFRQSSEAARDWADPFMQSEPHSIREPAVRRESPGSGAAPVRITIGRVEVRAVFPPMPAPARANQGGAKPALTLEEYTKQRNRRER